MINSVLEYVKSRRITVLAAYLVIAVAILAFTISPVVSAASFQVDSDSRMVTIYDDGQEKTIITKGSDVAAALSDAHIDVNRYDDVQPSAPTKLNDNSITIVNIRRARPVTVVDGGRRTRVMTTDSDSGAIAKSANSKLKSNDTTAMSGIEDLASQGGVGEQMKISRAKTTHVTLYGQQLDLRTQQPTVKDLLAERNIKLQSSDTVSVPLNTKITDGLSFQVWRNGIQTVEQTEDVPFDVQKVDDATKKVGYHEVQTTGHNGKKTVIYQVEMRDGQEVGRTKISEVVTDQPVTQVEINGTKVELPPGSCSDWITMAGVSDSQKTNAYNLIMKESGCRPDSTNTSSGACGIPQALPCSKLGAAKGDPVAEIRWMQDYVIKRYGSWDAAWRHSQASDWY